MVDTTRSGLPFASCPGAGVGIGADEEVDGGGGGGGELPSLAFFSVPDRPSIPSTSDAGLAAAFEPVDGCASDIFLGFCFEVCASFRPSRRLRSVVSSA